MITDTEVKIKGVQALTKSLGSVAAERFIALIQREAFDYTKWQRTLWEGASVEEISRNAMKIHEKLSEETGKAYNKKNSHNEARKNCKMTRKKIREIEKKALKKLRDNPPDAA